jgi:phosphatidate phosphatase APP1
MTALPFGSLERTTCFANQPSPYYGRAGATQLLMCCSFVKHTLVHNFALCSETLTNVNMPWLKVSHPNPGNQHRASRWEDAVQAFRARLARKLGHVEHVLPFSGYGSTDGFRVLCRVLLLRTQPTRSGKQRKVRGWRSFVGVPVADARVVVSINNTTVELFTDRGGVIDHHVPISLPPGWHTVSLRTAESQLVKAKVLIVSPETTLGVVCDIDDTVMVTALPRPFLAAWNSFVRDEHARRPVPGMAVLLERLSRDNPGAPIIYLSTGAWNVAPTLERFLGRHLYPKGPLLLTDWGPTHDRWFRSGPEHKRTNLRRLAAEFPGIRWVLLGDDGQHDEEIYGHFAREFPERVRAIAIRELLTPEALFAGGRHHLDRTKNPLKIPWVSAPNGAGLAKELAFLGVLNGPKPQE